MAVQRISHYEIEATLGEGAMGRVYRARDVTLDRYVALKVLAGASLSDPSFLERFRREARLAAQLNHPHIARIYEFGEENNQPFLVMELVEGSTLSDLIARGPLPVDEVCRLGRQMASALAAAHAKGIVHRDIKPGNLMVTPEGSLLVMDFGVARRAGDSQLTTDGSLMGTPNTMAPETISGEEPGPPADLFSAGCVLYEMLTGKTAFRGGDPLTVLFQIIHGEPEKIATLRDDVPEEIVALVDSLLVKEPEARFGPASAVVLALGGDGTGTHGLSGTGGLRFPAAVVPAIPVIVEPVVPPIDGPPVADGPPAADGPTWRRRPLLWTGIAAVLILAVGAVLLPRMKGDPAARRADAEHFNDALGAPLAEKLYLAGLSQAPPESLAQARRYFEEATRADPDYPNPWHNLGDLAYFEGDIAGAERAFRKAIDIDPGYAVARIRLADILDRRGQVDQAEAEYRKAMADDSTLVAAPNNLGYLLVTHGRGAEAVEVLTPALRRWPEIPALWKNYGLGQLAIGNLAEADSALRQAVALDPENGAAWAGLARVAAQSGDRNTAAGIWQKLASFPDTALVREAREELRLLMFGS